jgi:nitrate reductase molybdenum cofactor assembly chaperone NarJ/NarW
VNTQTVKLASVLLQYRRQPGSTSSTRPRPLRARSRRRESFGRFLGWLRATPPNQVARHYVQTFDLRRGCSLYLTYYRYGDTISGVWRWWC